MSTPRACHEWSGDLAALALGTIDPRDAVRVRAHVDGCAACRAELSDLQRTAGVLPLVDPDALLVDPSPPLDLADRILTRVRDEQHLRRARRRRRTVAALAAAAAIVVAVTVGAVVRDEGPAAREFAVEAPGVDATFTLRANGEGTAVRLDHQGLDPEDVYWLWLTDASGKRVSAGTFHGSTGHSSLTLQSAMDIDDAVRIWVTDESDGVVLDATL
jgi:anti-sigma-K factor RskA/putative zinc finger protein